MSVDKCFQCKSHQDQQHDHSRLYTETLDQKYGCRCDRDDCHQNGVWKVADCHQEGIAEGIFDGVIKFGKYRIDVKENDQVQEAECNEKNVHHL